MKLKRLLTIAHLYPAEMNIYGDRGNIITLTKRLEWRGIRVAYKPVDVGDIFNFRDADIIFGGGGQDRGQLVITRDLQRKAKNLRAAAEDGVTMLTICGLYQLFGHGFMTVSNGLIRGIGVFDAETQASELRMIGNLVVKSPFGKLVGFENHSGQTTLADGQSALGRVAKGYGNNQEKYSEGAIYKNVFGSYMHGPLLPKNPHLADELIARALARKYGTSNLSELDDSLEYRAAKIAASRPT